MTENSIIKVRNLSKSYGSTEVLKNLSVDIEPNQMTVLVGPSGSGKTTLLDMMSTVGQPDSGSIEVKGFNLEPNDNPVQRFKASIGRFMRMSKWAGATDQLVKSPDSWVDITQLNGDQRARYRAENGQIFQQSGLLSGLTAKENIESVHALSGNEVDKEWVQELAELLEVQKLLGKKMYALSGGQAQRMGIIRALAHRPELVFADEPTASLDTDLKDMVNNALRQITREGTTVVMVSHEPLIERYADTVVEIAAGSVKSTTSVRTDSSLESGQPKESESVNSL